MDIKIFRKNWDPETEKLAKKLKPSIGIDILKQNVDNGNISLYEVQAEGKKIGVFFARIETLYTGDKQLVVIHAVAETKISMPMTSVLSPLFDRLAKENDAKSIRICSDQRAMDKILEDAGYRFYETTFIKRLGI